MCPDGRLLITLGELVRIQPQLERKKIIPSSLIQLIGILIQLIGVLIQLTSIWILFYFFLLT